MIFLRMKGAFEAKWKTFFKVSQLLSFRLEKQTSKNVADTTFKTWFLLLYLFSNVKSDLIYFIQLILQHQTVAREFESSNRNGTGV